MLSEQKLQDLIHLVRRRYPQWQDFEHPPFVADELDYKRDAVAQAQELINQAEMDRLIADEAFETLIERLDKLGKATNLLWRQVPMSGDTAVLYQPHLDKADFCTQMRNLLYAGRPSPQRLHSYADYLEANGLPNKWPFPTYFLFLCHPDTEMFVKPRTATWFLKFMGQPARVIAPPTAAVYATILEQATILREALEPYGARDMVAVQSFIWVCAQEGKKRTGRLDPKGQVDLDIPPTRPLPSQSEYELEPETAVIAEPDLTYDTANSAQTQPVYTLAQWAAETGFAEEALARWVQAITRKGQAIFYGPPGTGKTFMAEKMAQHLAGGGDGFWELVQFHPAYAYEDFIQGIRPVTQPDGTLQYEMVPGRFLQFCAQAGKRNGICVFVIDEINRANVAAVFGELMYLLEYREREIPLAGGGTLRIPENVRIVGTMNTADRSIALVDHALRRRFAFIHLQPNDEVLRHYHGRHGVTADVPLLTNLIAVLHRLNDQIGDPDYHLGPSFFMHPHLANHIADIWRMEIEPYLEEQFFDRPEQVEAFRWERVRRQIMPQ